MYELNAIKNGQVAKGKYDAAMKKMTEDINDMKTKIGKIKTDNEKRNKLDELKTKIDNPTKIMENKKKKNLPKFKFSKLYRETDAYITTEKGKINKKKEKKKKEK